MQGDKSRVRSSSFVSQFYGVVCRQHLTPWRRVRTEERRIDELVDRMARRVCICSPPYVVLAERRFFTEIERRRPRCDVLSLRAFFLLVGPAVGMLGWVGFFSGAQSFFSHCHCFDRSDLAARFRRSGLSASHGRLRSSQRLLPILYLITNEAISPRILSLLRYLWPASLLLRTTSHCCVRPSGCLGQMSSLGQPPTGRTRPRASPVGQKRVSLFAAFPDLAIRSDAVSLLIPRSRVGSPRLCPLRRASICPASKIHCRQPQAPFEWTARHLPS